MSEIKNCVFVLNMRGQELMPTSQRNARLLLKQDKAAIVSHTPFVIQLKYPTGGAKQTMYDQENLADKAVHDYKSKIIAEIMRIYEYEYPTASGEFDEFYRTVLKIIRES